MKNKIDYIHYSQAKRRNKKSDRKEVQYMTIDQQLLWVGIGGYCGVFLSILALAVS